MFGQDFAQERRNGKEDKDAKKVDLSQALISFCTMGDNIQRSDGFDQRPLAAVDCIRKLRRALSKNNAICYNIFLLDRVTHGCFKT